MRVLFKSCKGQIRQTWGQWEKINWSYITVSESHLKFFSDVKLAKATVAADSLRLENGAAGEGDKRFKTYYDLDEAFGLSAVSEGGNE